jgi:hypothetical protein
MTKIGIALILTIGLLFTGGCSVFRHLGGQVAGSGNRKTEKRDVTAFTSISASGAFNVEVVCQKERSVTLEGDDNILPLVTTEVKGTTLYLDSKKGYSTKKPIVVRITVPDLDELSSSGAGEFNVSNIKNDSMRFKTSGAATINASGETKSLRIEMSGAGSVATADLKANDVDVTMSGAGSADVYAATKLDANISGAGSITYSGDPVVTKNVSGIGSIEKKGKS